MVQFKTLSPKSIAGKISYVDFGTAPKTQWPCHYDELTIDYRAESIFRLQEHSVESEAFFSNLPETRIVLQLGDFSLDRVKKALSELPILRSKLSRIELHPLHHLHKVAFYQEKSKLAYQNFQYESEIRKPFIFMNRAVNFSRTRMMEKFLGNQKILDNSYVSWLNRFNAPCSIKKKWTLDSSDADQTQHLFPPEYQSALVDVFCESNGVLEDFNPAFLTEKTWRPLLCGHLFLSFGGSSHIPFLKNQGFKLYDEIFDYSYDSCHDFELRLQLFFDNLEKLNQLSESAFFKKTLTELENKIQYNRTLAQDLALKPPLIIAEEF